MKNLCVIAVALAGFAAAAASAQSAPDAAAASASVSASSGEATYQTVCAACHMPDAMGASGAGTYPALASNPRLIAGAYPLYVVMKGKNGMPPMGDMLTDTQVADVVNYVRTHFGNDYAGAVTPEQVMALR